MGLMAGITHALFKRRVVYSPARFEGCGFMTIGTELIFILACPERFWIGRRLMTPIALNGGHWVMGARFQKLDLQ